MKRKRVVVLGATGSIGDSTLKVANDIPERMEIVGLAANSNAEKLAAAANITRPKAICLVDERKIDILRAQLQYEPKIFAGQNGLREIARLEDADMVLILLSAPRDCIRHWMRSSRAKIWRWRVKRFW